MHEAPQASQPSFRVLDDARSMVFPRRKTSSPRTGRTNPRTIWTGHQESGVIHQLISNRPPVKGMPGLHSNKHINNSSSAVLRPARKAWHSSAPTRSSKWTREGRRSQDEPTPQLDPCYTRGLGIAKRPNPRSQTNDKSPPVAETTNRVT